MLKKVSLTFGVVFLLLGLLGFVPGITSTDSNGMQQLFGLFMVDPVHNGIHIVTGLLGLWAAMSERYSKWFLVGFGVLYALVAVIGFFDANTWGIMKVNAADNWLHVLLAVLLLGTGLGFKEEETSMPAGKPAM